jgi:hypothetical protein
MSRPRTQNRHVVPLVLDAVPGLGHVLQVDRLPVPGRDDQAVVLLGRVELALRLEDERPVRPSNCPAPE